MPQALDSVLVVEDESLLRFILMDAFEEAGFAVLGAGTGDEGWSLLTSNAVSALVTDVQMPGRVDGLELADLAIRLVPTRPVVICTELPISSLGNIPGGALVLPKPCAAEVIVAAVTAGLRETAPTGA